MLLRYALGGSFLLAEIALCGAEQDFGKDANRVFPMFRGLLWTGKGRPLAWPSCSAPPGWLVLFHRRAPWFIESWARACCWKRLSKAGDALKGIPRLGDTVLTRRLVIDARDPRLGQVRDQLRRVAEEPVLHDFPVRGSDGAQRGLVHVRAFGAVSYGFDEDAGTLEALGNLSGIGVRRVPSIGEEGDALPSSSFWGLRDDPFQAGSNVGAGVGD